MPKLVAISNKSNLHTYGTDSYSLTNIPYIIVTGFLTISYTTLDEQEYNSNLKYGRYAKLSSDGMTLFWYGINQYQEYGWQNSNASEQQYNVSGTVYHYIAIG